MGFIKKMNSGQLTKQCLAFDERPSTPPHIRKFRRSAYLEPGKRFQHPGVADDYEKMGLEEKVFGITDRATRDDAGHLIHMPKQSEYQRLNALKSEKLYRSSQREPLGRSPERKLQLPDKFLQGEAFGLKTNVRDQPAKELIFPSATSFQSADNEYISSLYKRSHGSYAPGEQKSRHYEWSQDPTQVTFGRRGDVIALNGVSTNIKEVLQGGKGVDGVEEASGKAVNPKKVEDFRNLKEDMLARSKNLGQGSGDRPMEFVYGKPSGKKAFSAGEILRGKYSELEQQPDRDLGKSVLPGFRNLTVQDRVYGCPSIRSDIPAPHFTRRSLASTQNYGDDVPAQDLVNPPAFADLAIGPMAFSERRDLRSLLPLFRRVGYDISDELGEMLFQRASGGEDTAAINAFRDALTAHLISNNLVEVEDANATRRSRK